MLVFNYLDPTKSHTVMHIGFFLLQLHINSQHCQIHIHKSANSSTRLLCIPIHSVYKYVCVLYIVCLSVSVCDSVLHVLCVYVCICVCMSVLCVLLSEYT